MTALDVNIVSWIGNLLSLDAYKIDRITVEGLVALKVSELARIWTIVQSQLPPNLRKKVRSGARKHEWIDAVENALMHDLVLQNNTQLQPYLDIQSKHCNPIPGRQKLSQISTTQSVITPKSQSANHNLHHPYPTQSRTPLRPQEQWATVTNKVSPRTCVVNGYHHYLPRQYFGPPVQFFPGTHPSASSCYPNSRIDLLESIPTFSNRPKTSHPRPKCTKESLPPQSKSASSHATTLRKNDSVKVKSESGIRTTTTSAAATLLSTQDDDYRPLTFEERHIMAILNQMGFDDEIEIIQAIRSNKCPSLPNAGNETVNPNFAAFATTADMCMMWIIRQREEQEEAKKMDEARARSELLRNQAENSMSEENFAHSSIEQVFTTMFPTSVVLKVAGKHLGEFKLLYPTILHNFLKLEKKVIMWYKDVSWCYLVDLAEKWKTCPPTLLELETTFMELEQSVYSLEKQYGGVPLLFFEKRRNAELLGKSIRPPDGTNQEQKEPNHKVDGGTHDDDDDDVVVLMEPPTKKSKGNNSMSPPLVEVIEIDD